MVAGESRPFERTSRPRHDSAMDGGGTQRRVACFVSYDHRDQTFVDFLDRMLALYRDRIELLRDRSGVDRRSALDAALRAMIARTDVFMPVVSPAYAESEWCRREHAWLGELSPAAAVLPLRTGGEVGAFPNHLGVDFTSWEIYGDRIVREALIPALLGNVVGSLSPSLDLAREAALSLARDFQVLGSAVNRADLKGPAAEAFAQIGVRLMQLPSMPARGRARIASAIAGQQIQRGRWDELRRWASVAVAQTEVEQVADQARTDDELAFLGERYSELGLAQRRLGSHGLAAEHYEAAAEHYAAIRDRLLQSVRQAQVRREQGTLAIARLRLDEARRCYAESRSLLAGVPSERMHVAQAWIKEAQVELIAGRDMDSARCLSEAAKAMEVESTAREAELSPPELTARVSAHYWKTRAWLALALGQRRELTHAADEHARVIGGYPWDNERAHQRLIRRAALASAVIPAPVTRQVARALIVGEAGLFARVIRPVRAAVARWTAGGRVAETK